MPKVLIYKDPMLTHMWDSMPCREDSLVVNSEATTKGKKMYFVIVYFRGPWKGRLFHVWTYA